jgi:hypothetical protein
MFNKRNTGEAERVEVLRGRGWLQGELKRAIVHLSCIPSMGIGWEDMEHISTPRAACLPEDLSEGVKGETNQRVRERNWWLCLDGNIEQKLEGMRDTKSSENEKRRHKVGREIGNRVQEIWLAIVGRYQIKQELY